MSPRAALALGLAAVAGVLAAPPARAQAMPPTATATRTANVAAGLSAQDLELARYLDVLEDLELLENLELLEMMPLLEDE